MDLVRVVLQLIVAFGIFNVWLVRFNKATAYRGSGTSNMKEEFKAYGLPVGAMLLIGLMKLSLATSLLVGIWMPEFVRPAAIGLALLMGGAVFMHLKVKDPVKRLVPAFLMLVMCVAIACL